MHVKSVTVSAALSIAAWPRTSTAAPLVSWPGLAAAIPSWDLQSSARTGQQLETLSHVGFKTASWHHIRTSKCTLMGCLLEAGVYSETELFYSDNLRNIDQKQFSVPWIYRSEFLLEPGPGKHFWLMTHGISSRADIFLNGRRVASSSEQAGSYAGRTYDITNLTGRSNALAIQAYPTSYYRDFAIGWVDWNPWPADNGTGVWRDVEVKQTGPVALGPLRVVTQLGESLGSQQPANVTLKARAQNLESSPITITAAAIVALPSGGSGPVLWNKTFTLPPLSTADIVMDAVVERPAIWWPRQWGDQPLYTANLAVWTADGSLSDYAAGHFGFRTVTSALNAHNDTLFTVNGQPFEVIGAGYAPDMFLRWDAAKTEAQLRYVLDLGFNTIRLEGKNEHPELYALADRLGIMIMPGWECCDKWEAWSYNDGLAVPTPLWTDADYTIANNSMLHEAAMMQPHPSVLAYLIGSDYWPDERATPLYLSALQSLDWHRPVIVSAASQGFSPLTGPSGMKMDGPYDWVPPNYWFATSPTPGDPSPAYRLGAAFGFNSELSPGVGTPPLSSLNRFLSGADLADLWRAPSKNLSHMSPAGSSFRSRAIYNAALFRRWGAPTSLDDYLLKAQLSDYEATRAQFEAYAARWAVEEEARPATGVIYWMLNNAWPGLHWHVWDYYLRPAGAYFGAKVGCRVEHVVYDYVRGDVYLINRSLDRAGERMVEVEVMGLDGTVLYNASVAATTSPNASRNVTSLAAELARVATDVVFLRLVLSDAEGGVLSRNVYWLGRELDVLDWDNSNWYVTSVTKYANFTALNRLAQANVTVVAVREGYETVAVALENQSGVPAFFLGLSLVDREGRDVLPLTWEDNYVTLWPGEGLVLRARAVDARAWKPAAVQVVGKNVGRTTVRVAVL